MSGDFLYKVTQKAEEVGTCRNCSSAQTHSEGLQKRTGADGTGVYRMDRENLEVGSEEQPEMEEQKWERK